ncbi:MAG: glycosyltransferase [Pyrobaculum sp.]|jgi:glycosyltransferase involved in cell wall biosynthesis|nr:glycosyltransferase [Pyrobaculum sp.]
MKILIATPMYHPHIGGVEYVVKSVAERLAKMGHAVTVLAGEPGAKTPRTDQINGVQVIRWPTRAPNHAYHIPKKRDQLRNLLRKLLNDADAVHIHSAHAVLTVWTAATARRINPSMRIVFTPHYHGTGHSALRRLLWIPWRRYVARAVETADAIHAVSPREAQLLKSHYPQTSGKTVVIPNGVEEDVFSHRWRGADSGYMMYAGRVEKYKRLEVAVNVARELGLRLLVVGRGPHREKLRRYARRCGAAVEFLDPQPRPDYLRLLAGARYAVNPSRQEAYSIFAAEALAMGVPTITTPEVAENLVAEQTPFRYGLVLVTRAMISNWEAVIPKYLSLYRP